MSNKKCIEEYGRVRSPYEIMLDKFLIPLGFKWEYGIKTQNKYYVLDFYHKIFKLAIEIDTKYHEYNWKKKEDIARDKALFKQYGIETVRFKVDEHFNPRNITYKSGNYFDVFDSGEKCLYKIWRVEE